MEPKMICMQILIFCLITPIKLALTDNKLKRALSDAEKLKFVSKSVSWIQGQDTMDSCFILNFGYEAALPWPQVRIQWGTDNLGQNFGS